MFFFKKKPKKFLGVDIGASSIKLVELSRENGRYNLTNYAVCSLERYLKEESYKIDAQSLKIPNDEIANLIKKSINAAKIEAKDACFSVPVRFSFSTLIDFPKDMPDKQIAAAIPFEARKYIPAPIAEVALDWNIIDGPNEKATRQVVLVAVPKKLISEYVQIAHLAGLTSKTIEEETFSLCRSLIGNDKSTIALIDMGARSVNVSIIDKGLVRVSNNLDMGGANITRTISARTNIDLDEAEKLKKEISMGKSGDQESAKSVKESLNVIVGDMAHEIENLFEVYQQKYNRKIENCILVGQAVQLSGLSDYLRDKLALNVTLGNPFARVVYPPFLKPVVKELGVSLAVAIGLAMQ